MTTDAEASQDPYTAPHFATSALITIDVQRDFLSEAPYGVPGTTEILPALRRTVAAFRDARRPVVHIVRLYEEGGGNADLVRRRLLESGARLVVPGSSGSELADGLLPEDAPLLDPALLLSGRPQRLGPYDHAVFKPRWGAFYRTCLEELLRDLGVDTLVFAGCNLPNCPRASIVQASERDFRVVLVRDAVSRVTESALSELVGMGVELLETDTLGRVLAGHGHSKWRSQAV
ncbi:cysteine hydrolase family protein [Streptomyces sp. Amel2xC10]|uniref:cysteine hydrolase family protein n=1 Tax=Streptomyces sp. Amel2xC10 TaxID=1305826 RepID=UPI000A08A25C|nr:cysteine hydrolase [Streptomyces sp. Amel2xC10]SMF50949.1 Nicotinamidase-related amidase [Streptomyces sp. Amel2xC10]